MLRRVIGDDWIVGPGIDELARAPAARPPDRRCRPRHARVDGQHRAETCELCLELGVKAVITDRPAYMLELLEGHPARP